MKTIYKTKIVEKVIEPIVEKQPVAEPIVAVPEAPKTRVSLRVFKEICGQKPDQIAGFMYYAKINKLDNLSFDDWKKKVIEFNNCVVK